MREIFFLGWKIPFLKSGKRQNQIWSRILNISSQTGDIWQKLNMGFSTIFGDFPPSINSCAHERKIFLSINKDHFRSLKKAKSSFEVGFLISFLKPEIFNKNGKKVFFYQFLVIFIFFFIFSAFNQKLWRWEKIFFLD